MEAKGFDKIVQARADERVRDKILRFERAMLSALREFAGASDNYKASAYGNEILTVLATPCNNRLWPPRMWREEEALVEKELLATMDEMQRALLAASRPKDEDGPKPRQENETEGT